MGGDGGAKMGLEAFLLTKSRQKKNPRTSLGCTSDRVQTPETPQLSKDSSSGCRPTEVESAGAGQQVAAGPTWASFFLDNFRAVDLLANSRAEGGMEVAEWNKMVLLTTYVYF